MRDLVRRFFSKIAAGASPRANHDSGHDARVATCALFLEMAKIDETFSHDEMAKIMTILEETYGLSAADAGELVAAAEQELEGSIDYWHFARLINENYSTAEKLDIIEMLWRIVYVDGKLDKFENHLIHKLSNILRLSHEQLIEAKLKVLRSPNAS